MSSPPASDNPYASPETESNQGSNQDITLGTGERIRFGGIVSRTALLTSLRTRFSWSVLATLGTGALICLVAAPDSFLNPFRRVGRIWVDPLDELLGLVGLGFITIAVWHVIGACTQWSVVRRERRLLQQSPRMYTDHISGWLGEDCLYLQEAGTEAWIAWDGVGFFQFGDKLLLIDWGSGVTGNTVLTSNLFEDEACFKKAGKLFVERVSNRSGYRRLCEMPDYFSVRDCEPILPDAANVVGETKHEISCRDAWWAIVRQIPTGVFVSSRPLHTFFGLMALMVFGLVEHLIVGFACVVGIWLTIVTFGILVSISQHVCLLRRADRRLIASRTRFTRREVIVQTTTGCFRAPLQEFAVTHVDSEHFEITHQGRPTLAPLGRNDFRNSEEWLAVRQLLDANTSPESL